MKPKNKIEVGTILHDLTDGELIIVLEMENKVWGHPLVQVLKTATPMIYESAYSLRRYHNNLSFYENPKRWEVID